MFYPSWVLPLLSLEPLSGMSQISSTVWPAGTTQASLWDDGGILTLICALKEGRVLDEVGKTASLSAGVWAGQVHDRTLSADSGRWSVFTVWRTTPETHHWGDGIRLKTLALVFFLKLWEKILLLLHQSSIFTVQTGCTRWPIHPTTV